MKLPNGIFLRLSALVLGTTSALAASAQVTSYTRDEVGAKIWSYQVDSLGRDVFDTISPNGAVVNANGTWSTSPLFLNGISSDGRIYGSTFDSQAGYLDFSGTLQKFDLSPQSWGIGGSSVTKLMAGRFSLIEARDGTNAPVSPSTSSRLEIYDGQTIIGTYDTSSFYNFFRYGNLTDQGTLIFGHYTEVGEFVSSVRKADGTNVLLTSQDGAGIIQQSLGGSHFYADLVNANDLGVALTGWMNSQTGEKGYTTYDSTSGAISHLDSSFGQYDIRSMNSRGEFLATKLVKTENQTNFYDVFFYGNSGEWTNVSETTGLGSLVRNATEGFTVGMTNDGTIYGTKLVPYPNQNYGVYETFRTNPVPEPGTMLLLAAGAGGLIAARRKRKV